MSSLSAAGADGYYVAPDAGEGSRAWARGRARDRHRTPTNQFERSGVVRFELPWRKCVCLRCGAVLSRGTRFNAKKEDTGRRYFSSKIWRFGTTCPQPGCVQRFGIETDPENRAYRAVEGLRVVGEEKDEQGKEQDQAREEEEEEEENERDEAGADVSTAGRRRRQETSKLRPADAMARLERDVEGKRAVAARVEALAALKDAREEVHRRDFEANAALRRMVRESKKRRREKDEQAARKGLRDLPLDDIREADREEARRVMRCTQDTTGRKRRKQHNKKTR